VVEVVAPNAVMVPVTGPTAALRGHSN